MNKQDKIKLINSLLGIKKLTQYLKYNYPEIYGEISKKYQKYINYTFLQKIFWYINDIDTLPSCEICHKNIERKITSIKRGYGTYLVCSQKCMMIHPEYQNCRKIKSIERYGVESPNKLEWKKEKTRKVCLEKYGVEHPWQNREIYTKCQETCLVKYGEISCNNLDWKKEKTKQTWLSKYSEDNPTKVKYIKEKQEKTCYKNNGTKIPMQNERIKQKFIKTCQDKYNVSWPAQNLNILNKVNNTKRKNRSFNTSKPEEQIFQLLSTKFKNIDRQYKSDKYPFYCDFYISDIDTYIELNYTWFHGTEPYNDKNIAHVDKINEMYQKSKEINENGLKKDSYLNAIHIWSVRDVEKKQVAINNKLKWLCFYKNDQFIDWFNTQPSC